MQGPPEDPDPQPVIQCHCQQIQNTTINVAGHDPKALIFLVSVRIGLMLALTQLVHSAVPLARTLKLQARNQGDTQEEGTPRL